jgi:5-methylcytosine-specific restriction enzyme subunit McrC
LAAILLQWLSPGGTEGDRRFPAFLVNMFWLYEAFVRRSLELALRNTDYHVRKPRHLNLDESGRAHFQPDLLFTKAEIPTLVADCKYKRTGVDTASEADLYQMVAYCTALGLEEGILVYPRHLVDLDDDLAICSSTIRIHRMTIDLGLPRTELEPECVRLAGRLLDLHRLAPVVG